MSLLPTKAEFFYSDDYSYKRQELEFFPTEEFPSAKNLELNYPIIRQELEAYINGTINASVDNANPPKLSYDNSWKHLYFMNFLWQFNTAKKLFPKTYNIIRGRPDITLAGVALLEPGGKVLPHCGDTNAIVRCHLGLQIPSGLPDCGLRVKSKRKQWEEGKVICFNDAYEHEAWNLTEKKRYVLIFDIIKPEFFHSRKNICAYALGVLSFKYFASKMSVLKCSPLWLKKFLSASFALVWRSYLVFQP